MADVRYVITVDSAGAVTSIKNFEGSLNDVQKQSGNAASGMENFAGKMVAGLTIYNMAAKAFQTIKGELSDVFTEGMAAEKSEGALSSALAISGRSIEDNRAHYLAFAMAQHNSTLYTHEQVEAAQTLLLTMTHLNQDGIDKATKGAIGLSAVMGTDLQSAAHLVQKAMEGNTTALQRAGIMVDQSLPPAEKQAALLEKLGVLYGRAQAATHSTAGAQEQMNKAWDEAKEHLGEIVIKGAGLAGVFTDIKDVLTNLPLLVQSVTGVVGNFFANLERYAPAVVNTLTLMRFILGATAAEARNMAAAQQYQEIVMGRLGEKGWEFVNTLGQLNMEAKTWESVLIALGVKTKTAADETGNLNKALSSEFIKARGELSAEIDKASKSDYEAEKAAAISATAAKMAEYAKLKISAGEYRALEGLAATAQTAKLAAIERDYNQKIMGIRQALHTETLKGSADVYQQEQRQAYLEYLNEEMKNAQIMGAGKTFDAWKILSREALSAKLKAIGEKEAKDNSDVLGDMIAAEKDYNAKALQGWLDREKRLSEISGIDKRRTMTDSQFKRWQMSEDERLEIAGLDKVTLTATGQYAERLKEIRAYYAALRAADTSSVEELIAGMSQVSQAATTLFGAIAGLSAATTASQQQDLDDYLAYQKDIIAKSTDSEEVKAAKLTELDKNYNIAKKAIQRDAAIQAKNMAYVTAIINVAEAVTKALTGAIPPFNFVLAGLAAAAGAIQVATIAAQPIPAFQEGGAVRKTGPALVHAGEVILNADQARALRTDRIGSRGGMSIALTIPVYFGTKKVGEAVIDIIEDASSSGRLKIRAKSIQ